MTSSHSNHLGTTHELVRVKGVFSVLPILLTLYECSIRNITIFPATHDSKTQPKSKLINPHFSGNDRKLDKNKEKDDQVSYTVFIDPSIFALLFV